MDKKWLSKIPNVCELCSKPIGKYFIDGATMFGPWALMDEGCHSIWGKGLGLGRGQKYRTSDGVKIK